MARRKAPEQETADQKKQRQDLDTIADTPNRLEKMAFDRKMNQMVNLMSKLRPLEDQIIELSAKKLPIMDEIAALRAEMVATCVHPFDQLVHQGDHCLCKFCNSKISIPNGFTQT